MSLQMVTGYLVDYELRQIFLGVKQRGIGAGWYSGVGGKVDATDLSLADSLAREVSEEIGVVVHKAHHCGQFRVNFTRSFNEGDLIQGSTVVNEYFITDWEGNPQDSDEIQGRWFNWDDIPYDEAWPDLKYWLPQALAGEFLTGAILYDEHNEIIKVSFD